MTASLALPSPHIPPVFSNQTGPGRDFLRGRGQPERDPAECRASGGAAARGHRSVFFGPARPGQAVRLGGLRAPPGELGPRSRLARDAERAELGAVRPKWSGAPSEHSRITALWWEAERDPAGLPEVGEVLPRPSRPSSFAYSSLASFLPHLRKLFGGCFPSLLFFFPRL